MKASQQKFYTAVVIFVLVIAGILIAAQFDGISIGAMTIALLLVNSLLLLIVISMLLPKEKSKK